LFDSDAFRVALLRQLGIRTGITSHRSQVLVALDDLADGLEQALDIDGLFALGNAKSGTRGRGSD
jgi:cobyric acid synthase